MVASGSLLIPIHLWRRASGRWFMGHPARSVLAEVAVRDMTIGS
jgi:hypothetical protein